MRILVVEDEALVREVAVAVLEDAGHLVVEAADGEEALELIQGNTFDALFTDIKLPGRDGWTVAEDFRAVFPHAPVVFATGYAPRYQTFPHSILLNKPYRPAQVLQALTKLAA
jgi:CheY-like chemotaxis protein